MHQSLRISPAPFKPSRLSIPPSPFSPRSPFTPPVPHRDQSQHTDQQSSTKPSKTEVHAPSIPSKWTWTCHHCRSSYGLGVTRRCLDDGHYYCSGPTPLKAWREPTSARRTKKHGACSSEFDYSGWKEWSRWRRGAPRDQGALRNDSPVDNEGEALTNKKKNCWIMCDYPSECRWGKKFGIHTPVQSSFPVSDTNTTPTLDVSIRIASEGIPKLNNYRDVKTANKDGTLSFWTALLVSAEMRKKGSRRASSPLSAIAEENTATGRRSVMEPPSQDSKDDAVIATTRSSISSDLSVPQPSDRSTPPSVGGSLKPLLSRRRYRRGSSSSTIHNSKKTKQTREISTSKSDPQVAVSTAEAWRDWPRFTEMYRSQTCLV